MKNTLAPSVTTRDPKGLKFMSIVDGSYNKAGLSEDEAQCVNDTPGLASLITDFIQQNRLPVPLAPWRALYKEEFGLEIDFSSLVIPPRQKGFDRLLVIAAGVTCEQVFQKCRERFGAWKYTEANLDQAVPTNDRTNTVTYAIWVRDRVEADEEHKNQSANDLAQAKVPGITLLERLIYELKYFVETGKHLDIKNVTLCNGSRDSDGGVPSVHWVDGKLHVGWCSTGLADDSLRTRAVVS